MPACLSSLIGMMLSSKSPSSAAVVRIRFTLIKVFIRRVPLDFLWSQFKFKVHNYASFIQLRRILERDSFIIMFSCFLVLVLVPYFHSGKNPSDFGASVRFLVAQLP
ncbi:hypothetical protein BT93_L2115 [Corymbia citriodora subsp. variegata]|uniref:Uncharacterized protein n=1 Tax=Corymbia citriodora subsp. variegata TaxID=360336 RepID=A0A8T0CL62_CORYI|nr:hypothetical protein BT93_L2115 [Corymbia citriodora subsp. variegata]